MSTRNRYLLHGNQIVVISVDQRVLELGLDHLEAGRVVRMRDDLHCKRANVTEHGEENVGAAGIVDSNSRITTPAKITRYRARKSRKSRKHVALVSLSNSLLIRGAVSTQDSSRYCRSNSLRIRNDWRNRFLADPIDGAKHSLKSFPFKF